MGLSQCARGWFCATSIDGQADEADTLTCLHCQRVTKVRARQDPHSLGGYCRQCDGMICAKCVGKDCVPFMRKVEAMEEQYYRRKQLELMAGL